MKRAVFACLVVLTLAGPLWAATCTSVGSGLWSAGTTWSTNPAIPANGDTVIIANTHTVTFDVDISGFANGVTLTVNAGGTLRASESAGTYQLKTSADITLNGTLQAGTSVAVPYPSTCTFTINFNSTAKSIERSATGSIKLYCTQPVNRYVTITEAVDASTEKEIDVSPSVAGDWIAGQTVCIVDAAPHDVEYVTLDSVGAGTITVTGAGGGGGLDSAVIADSLAVLITRNIRIINVAASDYAITYVNSAGVGSGDYIAAEINNCYRTIRYGDGYEFAGATKLLATSPRAMTTSSNAVMSGAVTAPGTGTAVDYGVNCIISGVIAGFESGTSGCSGTILSGLIFGATVAMNTSIWEIVAASGSVRYSTYGLYNGTAFVYGTILSCSYSMRTMSSVIGGSAQFAGLNTDISVSIAGQFFNCLFAAPIENSMTSAGKSGYIESFNHNQVTNAFKAWCRGGVVLGKKPGDAGYDPPSGYSIYYELAAEDTTKTYPVFRQYETVVLPGTAIEVAGKIRIADGENFSSLPTTKHPQLQIIDKFADPLVDSTQVPLDYSIPADVTGTTMTWQDVACIWANQGDAPRQVIVRMIAYNDGGADPVYLDTVWAVAGYQEQIARIYEKLPANYIMGSSDQTDQDDDIDRIEQQTVGH